MAACFDGGAPETKQGRALLPFIRQFGLPRSAFDAIVEGVEMDLGDRRYETFEDLYEYCIRVASAVGLVCVEIFGYSDPGTRQYAIDLGVALQLTNILRDVPEDLAGAACICRRRSSARTPSPKRICGPRRITRRAWCDPRTSRRSSGTRPGVPGILRAGRSRAATADARRLVAAQIMGAVYRVILDRIESRDYDVFSSVVRIPRPRRALIAATTWMTALVKR